jgi:hypothetical protein
VCCITDLDTSCISIIILCDEAFKYGDYSKFWVHVWTNANPLCTEFCNFVKCQNFVNYFVIEYDKCFAVGIPRNYFFYQMCIEY